MSDNYLGKTLGGRYEVREVIGTGGMAVVYKAYCTVLHRYVAIKVLKKELAQDDEFRRRFYNEAQAVAKLSHNNIVSIYDVSRGQSGAEYIVMELCEGVTLKDYLRKKHHLSWQETVYFAQQVARALDHAHSRGIIHQDIKPQNIMLLRDGTAKVMDFGIASFANKQDTKQVSEAIGSVHYISPEQAKGVDIDYRTDLYSLGIVMYEMLTGTLPFRGETAVAVVMQHVNSVPPKPSELIPDIPPAMDEIVMHAMCPNTAQRYGSAAELYSDLERIRSNPNLYLNYTNRAPASGFGTTSAIRYDDVDQSTQLIRDLPPDLTDDSYGSKSTQPTRTRQKDKPRKEKKISGGQIFLVCLLAAMLAAMLFAACSIFGSSSNGTKIEVPEFIGMNYDTDVKGHKKYEKQFKLKVSEKEVDSDSEYEDGEIIDQDPDAGDMVREKSSVTLTVARRADKERIEIPDVSGMDYDSAVATLKELGFNTDRENRWSDTVAKRYVISTNPDAGEELAEGSTVVLIVSRGSEKVQVPDLEGLTQEVAASALSDAGLKLGEIDYLETENAVAGTIIGQSFEPGEIIKRGTKIGITIATAPSYVEPEPEPEDNTNIYDEPDDSEDGQNPNLNPEPDSGNDDGGDYEPDDGGDIISGDLS